MAEKAMSDNPGFLLAICIFAASSSLAGRLERRRGAWHGHSNAIPIYAPPIWRDLLPFRRTEDHAAFAEGLRKQGFRSDRDAACTAALDRVILPYVSAAARYSILFVRSLLEIGAPLHQCTKTFRLIRKESRPPSYDGGDKEQREFRKMFFSCLIKIKTGKN